MIQHQILTTNLNKRGMADSNKNSHSDIENVRVKTKHFLKWYEEIRVHLEHVIQRTQSFQKICTANCKTIVSDIQCLHFLNNIHSKAKLLLRLKVDNFILIYHQILPTVKKTFIWDQKKRIQIFLLYLPSILFRDHTFDRKFRVLRFKTTHLT